MQRVTHGDYFGQQGWYPASPRACQREVDRLLAAAAPDAVPGPLRGGIVPHAGWAFSGALAARTFAALARQAGPVDTVVLLGGHLGPRSRGWVLGSGLWPTPLGDVTVDEALAAALAVASGLPRLAPDDYEPDNTLELQLPLVKACFPDAALVAATVPARADALSAGARAVEAAAALDRRVVVVGSTDLTHYGPSYGFAPQGSGEAAVRWVKEVNDRRAVDLMVALDADALLTGALQEHCCCCPGAAAAALVAGRAAGATTGHRLATLTSHDVRPGSSFVGYASVVF
jgi:hypothetical protein